MQPKRLTQNAKKQLLTDCIKSGCVTDIANKYNVTRKTVYSHINKVSEAIDQSLGVLTDNPRFFRFSQRGIGTEKLKYFCTHCIHKNHSTI